MLTFRAFLFYVLYAPLTILFGLACLLLFLLPRSWASTLIVYWNPMVIHLLRLCCDIRYEVIGNVDKLPQPCVVVANHQSAWETLFLQWYCRPISAVLKKQLLSIPFFGWGLRLTQPIGIDRTQPTQAIKQIKSEGLARLKAGKNVLIFPEGTRMPADQLGSYMRSAADIAKQAGVPIVPIVHNAGYHWVNKQFVKVPGTIKVIIGEPIDLSEQNTKTSMQEIHAWTQEHHAAMIENKLGLSQ